MRTGFNYIRQGVSAEALRHLSTTVSMTARYGLDTTRRFDEQIPPDQLPNTDRLFPQVRLSTLSAGVQWDRRDNPITASSGFLLTAEIENALRAIGSEVGYIKTFVQVARYGTLTSDGRLVAAGRVQVGAARGFERIVESVDPLGNPVVDTIEDLPASQRFYAGGGTTVRGFQLDRLGVPEIIDPATGLSRGGNGLVIMNAELRAIVGSLFGRPLASRRLLRHRQRLRQSRRHVLEQAQRHAGIRRALRLAARPPPVRHRVPALAVRVRDPARPRLRVPPQHRGGVLMIRTLTAALCTSLLAAAPVGPPLSSGGKPSFAKAPDGKQVVIDRVVSRVNGEIITQSDIRQARLLRLFPRLDAASDDDAIRRALENRALVLAEVRRATTPDPSADRRAAWRRTWESSLGGTDVLPLLQRAGMTETALEDWCRNDLRIDDFLADRFKSVPEGERAREVDAWVAVLRHRAGLK